MDEIWQRLPDSAMAQLDKSVVNKYATTGQNGSANKGSPKGKSK
jgi:hypothetical protein